MYIALMYFPSLEPVCCYMSNSNCCFLTCIQVSEETGKGVWYSHLFQNFTQFVVIHTVKGFSVLNEAKVDVFFFMIPNYFHIQIMALIVVFKNIFIFFLLLLSLIFYFFNEFIPTFSLSSSTFIKRLFSSSLSAIRVVSSAYLRLLIFLPAILISSCASSSLAFHMIHSAYKLNQQGDNIQL